MLHIYRYFRPGPETELFLFWYFPPGLWASEFFLFFSGSRVRGSSYGRLFLYVSVCCIYIYATNPWRLIAVVALYGRVYLRSGSGPAPAPVIGPCDWPLMAHSTAKIGKGPHAPAHSRFLARQPSPPAPATTTDTARPRDGLPAPSSPIPCRCKSPPAAPGCPCAGASAAIVMLRSGLELANGHSWCAPAGNI